MKLPDLNNWLTLVANLAVLAGIVFLVIELDQSNRIAVAATESDLRASQRVFLLAAVENPEVSNFIQRSQNFDEIPAEEMFRFNSFVTYYFSIWASGALQYQNGLLSDYSLNVQIRGMQEFIRSNPASKFIILERIDSLGLERGMNVVWDALFDELDSTNH